MKAITFCTALIVSCACLGDTINYNGHITACSPIEKEQTACDPITACSPPIACESINACSPAQIYGSSRVIYARPVRSKSVTRSVEKSKAATPRREPVCARKKSKGAAQYNAPVCISTPSCF